MSASAATGTAMRSFFTSLPALTRVARTPNRFRTAFSVEKRDDMSARGSALNRGHRDRVSPVAEIPMAPFPDASLLSLRGGEAARRPCGGWRLPAAACEPRGSRTVSHRRRPCRRS